MELKRLRHHRCPGQPHLGSQHLGQHLSLDLLEAQWLLVASFHAPCVFEYGAYIGNFRYVHMYVYMLYIKITYVCMCISSREED